MGRPVSILVLLAMLKALHVVSVGTDRGEQNMTKAELRGQGTEVTPMQNAAVTVKEEWSRRPPGMAVEEGDTRWSHDTGNTNTSTTLLYPPAQHHSDSSNAPETPKPAALTDQSLKKLEDWSGNLFDKSSMTPGVRDTEEERGRAGKLSDMTSDDRDTVEGKSRSGKLSDMTSDDRDTGEEKSRSGKLSDMTSDDNDTGEERSWSGNPSDKSSMTSDGRDTGEKRSWSDTTPQKALTTSRPALEAEATREATKQHHWEDAALDSTTTARREEDVRQRMERLKTMNHNERMEQLKTMHLNVSSARRDDEAEGLGVTKRSWEHSDELAQRKTREVIYGDTEIDKSYEKWDCVCPRCPSPRKRNNLANVAYKKPSFLSSLWENLAGPCGGNNGNDDFVLNFTREDNNGYHSNGNDYRAWWWVDLNDFYTISTVTITLRNEHWKEDYNRNYNTVVTINGEVCYEFGTDDAVLRSLNFRNDYNCRTPIRGRYVMMQKEEFPPGRDHWYFLIFMELSIYACLPGHYWALSENKCVQCGSPCNYICDNLYGCNFIEKYNIAFKKAVEMSSEDYGNVESTVDGRTDSRLHYMECTASGTKAGQAFHPYWRVDLNGDYLVNSVVVKPRIDCCANKMKNLNVLVQNRTTDLARVTEHGSSDLCTHWEGTFQNGQEIKFTCTSQVLGKYVSLQTIRPSQLLLCEVQVFGYPVTVLGPDGKCNRLLTTICQEGLECDRGRCKVPPGRTCLQTDRRQHCRSGSICYAGVCKLVAGADCRDHQDSCARGTECDSTSGYKCQKSTHKTCSQTNQCARYTQGIECDHLKQCGGKGLGVTCVKKECVAGAKCENSKCQCTAGVSTASGKICVPEAGRATGDCSVETCTANAVCDTNNRCQCNGTYAVFREDFTCSYQKGQVGSVCSVDGDCSTAMVCEAQKCKFDTGQHCENNDECKEDDVCDDSTASCRLIAGSRCNTADLDACRFGTTCHNNRCYLEMGQECDTSNDLCIPSTGCSTNAQNQNPVCLRAPGQTCKDQDKTLCVGDSLCDKDQVCRIWGDMTCTASNAKYCALGTICQGGSCKLILGAPCKSNGTQCSQGLVCDMLGQCRISKDGNCAQALDGCLAGATCTSSHTCQCETDNCNPASGKIGSTCHVTEQDPIGQKSCKEPSSICNSILRTCQCGTGKAVHRHNFTCGLGAGARCNTSLPCAAGFVCENGGFCAIEVGETCEGRKSLHCMRGSVCDKDEFCRVAFDENCLTMPDMCELGTKCDSTGLCKIPVNKACSVDDECEAGSVCHHITSRCTCSDQVATPLAQGQGCDPKVGRVGGKCSGANKCVDPSAVCDAEQQKCECPASYETKQRDFSCTKRMGETCERDEECRNGAYCDSLKKCSLELGESCRGELKKNCGPEAICDRDDHCSIRMHGDCSGENLAYCEAGLFCDWLGKCRLDVGRMCNESSVCPSGAACLDSVCECVKGKAVVDLFLCKPAKGRVGSACDGVSSCTVPGAECVDKECSCDKGVDVTRDFACAGKSAASLSASPSSIGMVVGVSFGAVVTLVAVVAFVVYRRNRASLDWKPDIKERRLSLAELNKLSSGLENNPTFQTGMTSPTAATSEFATDSAIESSSMVESVMTSGVTGSEMTSGVTGSEIQSGMDTTSIAESEMQNTA